MSRCEHECGNAFRYTVPFHITTPVRHHCPPNDTRLLTHAFPACRMHACGGVIRSPCTMSFRWRGARNAGWTWRSVGHTFLQFVLNDKNTVLRSIDYFKFRQEDSAADLDPIASMSFYLAQDQASFADDVLAADILPTPSVADRIEHWRTFFGNQAQYLNAGAVRQRTVSYCARIATVDAIDPSRETFSGEVEIELEWGLTKTDLVEYLAAADLDTWRPAWSPCELEVQNGSGKHIKYDCGPIVPFVPDDGNTARLVVARQTILIRGEYFNDFELHSYPYDMQVLSVSLAAAHSTEDDANFVLRDHAGMSRIQNSEWRPVRRGQQLEFVPTHQHGQHGTSGRYCLDVSTVVMREYAIHRYRVIFPMAMFCLLSIGAFTLDPNEYVGDRFNVVITLLLTATAYSLTIAEKLPTLGYLTWLDKYILASFFFIMVVAVAIIFLNYADETSRSVDDTAAVVALGAWGLLQVLMYVITVRASRRHDARTRAQTGGVSTTAIPRRTFSLGDPSTSI
eukprot:m.157196 g.157196  ORF g.157196 m.157196 type:complete len:510 (+) comp17964_c0_seq5:220-1749(+)